MWKQDCVLPLQLKPRAGLKTSRTQCLGTARRQRGQTEKEEKVVLCQITQRCNSIMAGMNALYAEAHAHCKQHVFLLIAAEDTCHGLAAALLIVYAQSKGTSIGFAAAVRCCRRLLLPFAAAAAWICCCCRSSWDSLAELLWSTCNVVHDFSQV